MEYKVIDVTYFSVSDLEKLVSGLSNLGWEIVTTVLLNIANETKQTIIFQRMIGE